MEEFLRRGAHGNPDLIAEMYTDKVDWQVSWPATEHPEVPWIRSRSTRADVADHFRTFNDTCTADQGKVSIDQILIDGPNAVLVGTSSQLVRPTGKRFTMAFALHLTIEDGLLTRHHMYEDSLSVAEAFTDRAAF